MSGAASDDLIDEFTRQAAALGVGVTAVTTQNALEESIAAILGKRSWCAWDDPLIDADRLGGRSASPARAEVSIVRADAGIAATGSVAFAHGPGRPRAVALLPPAQIVVLQALQVVPDVAAALHRFFSPASGTRNASGGGPEQGPPAPDAARPPSNVVFVTGPSRTADIELHPLKGVHSPKEIDVILLS